MLLLEARQIKITKVIVQIKITIWSSELRRKSEDHGDILLLDFINEEIAV